MAFAENLWRKVVHNFRLLTRPLAESFPLKEFKGYDITALNALMLDKKHKYINVRLIVQYRSSIINVGFMVLILRDNKFDRNRKNGASVCNKTASN